MSLNDTRLIVLDSHAKLWYENANVKTRLNQTYWCNAKLPDNHGLRNES